jgi:FkbM family methyltransferase
MLSTVRDRVWLARQERARHRERNAQRRRQVEFYRQFVAPGCLVFDVGANVGERTDVFTLLGARVVAFEPLPALAASLRDRFARDDSVVIRETGLGAAVGTAVLRVGDESTISSMSEAWRDAVTASGRFADHTWETALEVPVSTLDAEISGHGVPAFCKIDVEGFELEVLRGLSCPIAALSVEYTHEQADVAEACLRRLAELGEYRFAFSASESMVLWPPGWVSLGDTLDGLRSLAEPLPWGDLYAVCKPRATV